MSKSENGDGNNPMAAKVQEYIREMITEKQQLDSTKLPHSYKLLDQGKHSINVCNFVVGEYKMG